MLLRNFFCVLFCCLLGCANANAQTLMTKGFQWSDYQASLKYGTVMTPVDMPLPDSIAKGLQGASPESLEKNDSGNIQYIIGGNNARRGEFDEYALVLITDGISEIIGACGGSLIASNKVLTAGHCSQESAFRYLILPKFYSFDDPIVASDFIEVSSVRDHPNYNSFTDDYDLGILTLRKNVGSKKAKIYGGRKSQVGEIGATIGVGLTSTQPPQDKAVLQKVNTPILSNSDCNSIWNNLAGITPITNRMMCAGSRTSGTGACLGDSGGPLFRTFDGERLIVGTVSFGLGVCEQNRGNQTYARVSEMLSFIRTNSPQTEIVVPEQGVVVAPVISLLLDEGDQVPLPPNPVLPPSPPEDPFTPAFAEEFDGQFAILIESDEGEWVGQGINYAYYQDTASVSFGSNFDNGISIDIDGFNVLDNSSGIDDWGLDLSSFNNQRLEVGIYDNATRFPFNDGNGISFSGNGRSCTTAGEFEIFEIEYDASNQLAKLRATFEQYCSSESLRGSIVYDSSLTAIEPQLVTALPEGATPIPALPDSFDGQYVISFESDEGDYIGQGDDYLYYQNGSKVTFQNDLNNWLNIRVDGLNSLGVSEVDHWTLRLSSGGNRLQVGVYENATDTYLRMFNIFELSGNGRGCSVIRASQFRVFEVEYNAQNQLIKLTADFEQFCEDSLSAMRGSIKYDSSLLPDELVLVTPFAEGDEITPALPEIFEGLYAIRIESDTGDFIGQGKDYEYLQSGADLTIRPWIYDSFQLAITGENALNDSLAEDRWRVVFGSPGTQLSVGVYQNASSDPFGNFNYLKVSSNYGCTVLATSRFRVFDVEYDASNELVKLVADFEQFCRNSTSALRGSIFYDASLTPVARQ